MFWKKDIKGLLTYDLNHFQMFNGIYYFLLFFHIKICYNHGYAFFAAAL